MNRTATLSVSIITLTLSSHAATYRVRTAEDFNRQAALLGPGDELVVKNGVYADWEMEKWRSHARAQRGTRSSFDPRALATSCSVGRPGSG